MHTRNTSSSEESRRQIKRDCFLCFRIPLIAELLTEKQCKNSPQNDRPVITLLPDFTACFDYPIHLLPGEINCQPLKSTQPEPLQKQHHKKHLCSGKRWDFLYTEVNFLSSSFCCHQLQHSWLGNEAAPRLQATWCRQQDLLWVLPYTGSGHGQCHQNSSHLSHKWGVLSSDKEWGSRSEYEAKSLKHSSITSLGAACRLWVPQVSGQGCFAASCPASILLSATTLQWFGKKTSRLYYWCLF